MATLSEAKSKTLPLNVFMAQFMKLRLKKSYEEAKKQKKA
jgi:hypothetical protein